MAHSVYGLRPSVMGGAARRRRRMRKRHCEHLLGKNELLLRACNLPSESAMAHNGLRQQSQRFMSSAVMCALPHAWEFHEAF